MRAFKSALGIVAVLSVIGCGDVNNLTCNVDQDCRNQTGTLFQDGSADLLPICCAVGGATAKMCALPAGGCDSGYRYMTDAPGYGDCIAAPMCPAPPADMTVPPPPADLSAPQDASSD
jgi:hypothetical protein